jgi:hypothetical protein
VAFLEREPESPSSSLQANRATGRPDRAVGLALQALDGTKIQAACSGPNGWSQACLEKLLTPFDAALEEIELKVVQENADASVPGYRWPAGLAERQALRQEIKKGLAQLEADGRSHYHPLEPEARRMKVGDTNRFAYHAQAVADSKAGVIVACAATRQETDAGPLAPMIEQARQNLGPVAPSPTTLADSGYGGGADLQAAAQQAMDVLVPPVQGSADHNNPYATTHFFNTIRTAAPSPVRKTVFWIGKARPPRTAKRSSASPAITGTVRCARFAQLKQHDGFRRRTAWELESVKTQWTLLCATLNLRVLYKKWQDRRRGAQLAAQVATAASPRLPAA